MSTNNLLAAAAHAYARRGLRVFPCKERGKEPMFKRWPDYATTDPQRISTWWASGAFNIAIATGPGSGIWVLDVDDADGEQALSQLEAAHAPLPATVEAITARGRHVYFKWPQSSPVGNTAGRLAQGIDTRGAGGYVLAPPSVHPSGRCYCWSVDSATAFAVAPQWLLDRIAAPAKGNGNGATPPSKWRELVATGVAEGQRNISVTKLAGLLLRRYVDPIITLDLLQAWNAMHCRPPLPPTDVETICNSIAGREMRRRSNGDG